MAYIGRTPNIGDRKILSVTGSSPATSYTLQHNSVNYSPSASQNLMVSVNGVIQEPDVAYTVSNATLDFNGVSVAIADIDFPKVVFMIINKKIELEIKYLKEYPEWSFLSEKDLNRKTIEVFFDVKNAKRKCGEDNKVIKVPNTRVFKIVAPILLSRGITRIISENQLISL